MIVCAATANGVRRRGLVSTPAPGRKRAKAHGPPENATTSTSPNMSSRVANGGNASRTGPGGRGVAFTGRVDSAVRRVVVVAAVLAAAAVLAWVVLAVVSDDAWVRGPALAASYGAPTAAAGLAAAALWAHSRDR